MTLLTEEVRAFIGVAGEVYSACCPVERSEVRRFAQAIMDDDPIYHDGEHSAYGGPVAPALFPSLMFRRDFATPDVLTERATDPDFDGTDGASFLRLPPLPLPKLAVLNGGSEVELFRYARHGETVSARSSYVDIFEKETSKGPMLFVVSETEYFTSTGEVLMKNRITIIRR